MEKPQANTLDILVIWRSLPTSFDSTNIRIFHLLKRSSKYGHRITLLAYDKGDVTGNYRDELEKYCDGIEVVNMPKNGIMHTLKEVLLSPGLMRHRVIPCRSYSRKMQKKAADLILQKRFDIIYCDRPMIPYVMSMHLPVDLLKVMDTVDPVLYSRYQAYLTETEILKKIWWLLNYYQLKIFEIPQYKKFDACVTVSPFHKEFLEQYVSKSVFVVPYGVDLEYFKEVDSEGNIPILIFTGAMSYKHNVEAVCHFFNKIFPLVRSRIPDARLYIVGKEPSKEVLELASDKSVTVTGFVEDVRPYFAQASVAIVPMVTDDGGFKTKILEAMAMGKPVVSTSIGAKGIDVTPGRDIVIADRPEEFAYRVLELLNDKQLCQKIGSSARKLVEWKYSWETMTEKLISVFEKIWTEHKDKR